MLKSFKELYKLDIKKYIKKKPTFRKNNGKLEKLTSDKWLDYLEWATVIFILYDNGASKVTAEFEANSDGYPAFFNNDKNPFVKVKLTIDDSIYHYYYPVINGNIVTDNPNQFDIHRAQQRALVKCVAINTGLGLSLWQKEEGYFDDLPTVEKDENPNNKPELKPGTEKWIEAVKALKNNFKITDIRRKYYMTEENENKLLDESI